jgi:hypothetical protein
MAQLLTKDQLPHLHSTRDTRDRLDLVKPEMTLGATRLSADRIIYRRGALPHRLPPFVLCSQGGGTHVRGWPPSPA